MSASNLNYDLPFKPQAASAPLPLELIAHTPQYGEAQRAGLCARMRGHGACLCLSGGARACVDLGTQRLGKSPYGLEEMPAVASCPSWGLPPLGGCAGRLL